jgi:hypothetical protein
MRGNILKTFDFYEFTGILVPGSITMVAVLLLFPQSRTTFFPPDLTVGDLGLFVVLAYAAGHITQAVGNGVEWLLWRIVGGMPTDWVRTRTQSLLAEEQIQALQAKLPPALDVPITTIDATHPSPKAWHSITRQIYADVAAHSRNGRVDTFNGNYGLNRGIASALLIGLVLLLLVYGLAYWQFALLLLFSAGVALYRTYRFGVRYARELFVQFLQIHCDGNGTTPSTDAPKQTDQQHVEQSEK